MVMQQRFSLKLTEELHEYYKGRSEKTGVAMSALVLLDLEKLQEQRQATVNLERMESMMRHMERGAGNEGPRQA